VGLPIFLVVMYVVFQLVVNVSAFFLDWVDAVLSGPLTRWVSGFLTMISAPDWLVSLAVDGVIAGVGAVLVFVPGLIVLYLFLTLLEDSGYMARVAFVMDRVMRFTGLHGKSFMPMILGFGCAVPAIYSTRTLESRNQRILTSLVLPLMSCSARLPVYVVFGLAFFGAAAGNVITALYVFGVVMAAIVATVMSRTILRERDDSVFALELPPYRVPMLAVLLRHTWQKTREFVVKAGTVIFVVVVILWFAMSLPWGVEEQRDSYFGQASAAIAPVFEPAGFGTWEATGALVTGFIAKEVVVSTMGQIYVGGEGGEAADEPAPSVTEDVREIAAGFVEAVDGATRTTISLVPGIDLMPAEEAEPEDTQLSSALRVAFTPLAAIGFLIFVLIYTPCVATLAAIRDEFGWRWAALSGLYQFAIAWLLAVVVFQVGMFLGYV
jgi:ferrous iron transport protein B